MGTLTAGMLGDIMLSWPLRIAGIIFAIAQLLQLAVKALDLRLAASLTSHLNLVSNVTSNLLGLAGLEARIRTGLAGQGIAFHPGSHWHQLFILLWLLMLVGARNARLPSFTLMATAALPCALATALAVASVPVDSNAVLVWTLAGLLASFAVNGAIVVRTWPAVVIPALGCAIAVTGGVMHPGPLTSIPGFSPADASTPLFVLASALAGTAVILIAIDLSADDGTVWDRLNDPGAATGVDILATCAGTLGLALAFAT